MRIRCGYLIAAVCFMLVMFVSSGTAQEGTLGDLGIRVRQEHLDSYWLDHKTWEEYGYRPYATTHLQHFGNLPSYSADLNEYSFGTTDALPSASEIEADSSKRRIQLTKYGTWH